MNQKAFHLIRYPGNKATLVSGLAALGARVAPVEKAYKASVGAHRAKTHQEAVVTNIGVEETFLW